MLEVSKTSKGEIISLLGQSVSRESTILNIIAGVKKWKCFRTFNTSQ